MPGRATNHASLPYPEMDHADHAAPEFPPGWQELWTTCDHAKFETLAAEVGLSADPLLAREMASLAFAREALQRDEIFAILIEPMQCEGGDRYASTRFHQGLAYLAETFHVPLVYDEIQTGFGLGGPFFWHRLFDLKRADGRPFFPNGVICAKKAQVGLSIVLDEAPADLSPDPREPISVASLIRGYIQASVVDQFEDTIGAMETANRQRLASLAEKYPDAIQRPRVKGMSFAFDLEPPEKIAELVGRRFEHGLLYYPAGKRTARFRFNLSFRDAETELFWDQLDAALQATLHDDAPEPKSIAVTIASPEPRFAFHEQWVASKLERLRGNTDGAAPASIAFLQSEIALRWPDQPLSVTLLDAAQFFHISRSHPGPLQEATYEPVRRSPAEEFEQLFASNRPLGVVVMHDDEIAGMAFAGPLGLFTQERGVEVDPHRNDPHVAYMLDLTVIPDFRRGLGTLLKQTITWLAQEAGYTAIHGRNRDRLAAGMWSINLSLGAFETRHLPDDYPDNHTYRDCFYYRLPTTWTQPPIDLSRGIAAPLSVVGLDTKFTREALPTAVNKITLSNFVTEAFLEDVRGAATLFPERLQHVYTANGLSEAIDKVVKVLWKHRQPRTRLLTFDGSSFGDGSFMARSLSGIGDTFFDVERLPLPFSQTPGSQTPARSDTAPTAPVFDWDAFAALLARDEWLGVFVEPLLQRTMVPWPADDLERLVHLCQRHAVPVVFNDSASLFYRYDAHHFSASGRVMPDATVAYLGGQMAMAFVAEELFLDEPLLLISTWEGDAFSLAQFAAALRYAASIDRETTMRRFQEKLAAQLHAAGANAQYLVRGCGPIWGDLPEPWQAMLPATEGDARICCPSLGEMQRFLDWDSA